MLDLAAVRSDLARRCRDEDAIQATLIKVWQVGERVQNPILYAREVCWRYAQRNKSRERGRGVNLAVFNGEPTAKTLPSSPLQRMEEREALEGMPHALLQLAIGESPRREGESASAYKSRVHRLRVKAKGERV